jgi:hypothetical protein
MDQSGICFLVTKKGFDLSVLSIGLWKHLALFLLWLQSEPTVIKSLLY